MRALLTKREAAELEGRSERWIELNASRFAMEAADKKSRNGRAPSLIHLSSLSPAAQRAWVERQRSKCVEILPAATSAPGQLSLALTVPAGPNLSPEDRAEAERRYQVIEPLIARENYAAVWQAHGNRKGDLVAWLAGQHKTAARTIYHWTRAFKTGGLPALVNRTRADKGRPRSFNSAALDFILAAALPRQGAYGTLSVKEIFRAYEEERVWRAAHAKSRLGEFELRKYARYLDGRGKLTLEAQLPVAAYETFRAWFCKIPDVVRVMAREGDEAFHNSQEIISFRDLAEIKPLDYVVMDHRRLDLFCLARDGQKWKLIRPWLTAAIDMRTRKWVGWSIVETPSSDSIASVLKRVFLDWGIPVSLYWDNGKDFRCEWLEGRQRRQGESYCVGELESGTRGVLETLGVRVHHAIVKRARAKIIEPCFIATANFDKTLPEYCGHKPDARPERLEKLVDQHERWTRGAAEATPFRTIEEIAGLYEEQLDTINEREHPGEGMRKVTPTGLGWMCPNEAWEMGTRGMEIRRAAPEVLAFCFHKRRTLTVRNGEIQPSFHGRQYHYRLADNRLALMTLNGREVEFAYDPHDLGTAALYCDGAFLGLAHNVELRRMGEDAFVEDERDRRRVRREVKKFIATVHAAVPVATPEERAARRMAVRPVHPLSDGRGSETVPGPAHIAAAVAAQSEERRFRFAEAGADLIRAAEDAAYRDDDPSDEFQFFQEG
jgi:hypothetical protein